SGCLATARFPRWRRRLGHREEPWSLSPTSRNPLAKDLEKHSAGSSGPSSRQRPHYKAPPFRFSADPRREALPLSATPLPSSRREIEDRWPGAAVRKIEDWLGVAPPGGESWADFSARLKTALVQVLAGPMPAAIVAHMVVNAALAEWLTGADPRSFRQQYGEI